MTHQGRGLSHRLGDWLVAGMPGVAYHLEPAIFNQFREVACGRGIRPPNRRVACFLNLILAKALASRERTSVPPPLLRRGSGGGGAGGGTAGTTGGVEVAMGSGVMTGGVVVGVSVGVTGAGGVGEGVPSIEALAEMEDSAGGIVFVSSGLI